MPESPANLPARKLLSLPHVLVQPEVEVADIDTPEDLEGAVDSTRVMSFRSAPGHTYRQDTTTTEG